jgi:parvulin-like peptidyl-prolyl isomerase
MKHLAILILVAGSVVAYSQTQQPEQVCLSEVLIRAPETATPAQVNEARHKAEQVRNAAQKGSSFSDLARANDQGPSAAQGGVLGCFKRGQLAKPLEEQVFRMKVGEISDVLTTKQGFVILQVTGHELESSSELVQQIVQGVLSTGITGKVVDKSEQAPIRNAYVLAH